jgi:peroxiredoxin
MFPPLKQCFRLLPIALWALLSGCASPGPAPGDMAPELSVALLDGRQVRLSDYRGKLLLLQFWTDWCDACRQEFPKLQEAYEGLAGPDFEVLAINVGQDAAVSQAFRDELGVTFPLGLDLRGELAAVYGVSKYPTNYLVNPEGRVARKVVGWIDRELLESVLYGIRQARK